MITVMDYVSPEGLKSDDFHVVLKLSETLCGESA